MVMEFFGMHVDVTYVVWNVLRTIETFEMTYASPQTYVKCLMAGTEMMHRTS
jgi:hypothetical protein